MTGSDGTLARWGSAKPWEPHTTTTRARRGQTSRNTGVEAVTQFSPRNCIDKKSALLCQNFQSDRSPWKRRGVCPSLRPRKFGRFVCSSGSSREPDLQIAQLEISDRTNAMFLKPFVLKVVLIVSIGLALLLIISLWDLYENVFEQQHRHGDRGPRKRKPLLDQFRSLVW